MSAKFAQHFLINAHAVDRIVEALHLNPDDVVLEIGPGKGALTGLLLKKTGRVIAIEIDSNLIETLKSKFGAATHLTLIHQDILDVNFSEFQLSNVKIVGNLPYNLTSPILRKLSAWTGWSQALCMVQKEVGDRLSARVGTSEYGALTVGMNLTCQIERVFDLKEASFRPAPRVKSAVVRFIRREKPLTEFTDLTHKVVQAAFQQRRKTILNSLSHGLNLPKNVIQEWLDSLKIDPSERPERLNVNQFIQITNHWRKITFNS